MGGECIIRNGALSERASREWYTIIAKPDCNCEFVLHHRIVDVPSPGDCATCNYHERNLRCLVDLGAAMSRLPATSKCCGTLPPGGRVNAVNCARHTRRRATADNLAADYSERWVDCTCCGAADSRTRQVPDVQRLGRPGRGRPPLLLGRGWGVLVVGSGP